MFFFLGFLFHVFIVAQAVSCFHSVLISFSRHDHSLLWLYLLPSCLPTILTLCFAIWFHWFCQQSLFMSFNSSPLSQLVEKGKTLHKHHCCPFLFGDWSSYPYQYITILFIECLCVYALLTFIICSLAFIEHVYTLNWMLSKFEV